MYDVIIADDENIIRLGMRSMIDWEAHGFKVTGTFANSREVLEYLKSNHPHVLITDIKMPGMDGIELIREVRRLRPELKIVVLSNYDDFQYVSKAFKIGACDYLLKQFIESDKLIEVLNSIREKIRPDYSAGAETRRGLPDGIEQFLESLLGGTCRNPGEEASRLGLKPLGDTACCFAVRLFKRVGARWEPYKGVSPSKLMVKNTVFDCIDKYCPVWPILEAENVLLAAAGLDGKQQYREAVLHDIFLDIKDTVHNYFNLDLHFGLSRPHRSDADLRPAFTEAQSALDALFFFPGQSLQRYTPPDQADLENELPDRLEKEIYRLIDINHYRSLCPAVSGFIRLHGGKIRTDSGALKSKILRILQGIDIFLVREFNAGFQSLPDGPNLPEVIQSCPDVAALDSLVTDLIDRAVAQAGGSFDLILDAKKFIAENYTKNIGLSDVSGTCPSTVPTSASFSRKKQASTSTTI